MPYEFLTYDKQDHIALITLNRPERLNALSRPLHLETLAAAEEARNDDDVFAVVVTGAGRGFCSGADIQAAADRAASGDGAAPAAPPPAAQNTAPGPVQLGRQPGPRLVLPGQAHYRRHERRLRRRRHEPGPGL